MTPGTEEERMRKEVQEHTHDCASCVYYVHAKQDPDHALTVCPICGMQLIEERFNDKSQ